MHPNPDALLFLSYLGFILLIGLITAIISNKCKIPNVLLLLLTGLVLGKMEYQGHPLVNFPDVFLTSISILALVMIIFDSASRISLKKFDTFSLKALWLSLMFLFLNMIFLTFFVMTIFNVKSVIFALVFSALMSGTDPAVVLTMLKNSNQKVFEILKLESLLNTPLVVLLPFVLLELNSTLSGQVIISTVIDQVPALLQQVVVGTGAGVLIGLVVFKFMRRWYSDTLSPLAIVTAALLTYTTAENMGGSGVLAVTAMGLLFGYVHLKEKIHLQGFALIFSNSLEILVFVLIGMVIAFPVSVDFFVRSGVLFVAYILIRFLAILITLRGAGLTMGERFFMTLNVQKGIAVAVVVFSLANIGFGEMGVIFNLAITFMLYSILLSTIVLRLAKPLVHKNILAQGATLPKDAPRMMPKLDKTLLNKAKQLNQAPLKQNNKKQPTLKKKVKKKK